MPHDKSKSNQPADEKARKAHTPRPTGQGTKVTGDAAEGKDKLDERLDAWKKDIDDTPYPDAPKG